MRGGGYEVAFVKRDAVYCVSGQQQLKAEDAVAAFDARCAARLGAPHALHPSVLWPCLCTRGFVHGFTCSKGIVSVRVNRSVTSKMAALWSSRTDVSREVCIQSPSAAHPVISARSCTIPTTLVIVLSMFGFA